VARYDLDKEIRAMPRPTFHVEIKVDVAMILYGIAAIIQLLF